MNHKIIAIAGITFAVIFVGLLSGVFQGIISSVTSLQQDLSASRSLQVNAELEPYDDQLVTGDMIISLIKKSEYVTQGKSRYYFKVDSKTYGWSGGTYITYKSSDTTINPVATYRSILEGNANGVVLGIKFTLEP